MNSPYPFRILARWLRSGRRLPICRPRRLEFVRLEDRDVPSITWTPVTNTGPAALGPMFLMPDGRDLIQVGSGVGAWDFLTPDATGSYINGALTSAASASGGGGFEFPATVLPTDQMFLLGGDYESIYTDQIYTLTSNQWAPAAPHPGDSNGNSYSDAATALLPPDSQHPDGSILAGGHTAQDVLDMDGHVISPLYNGSDTYLFDIATGTWSQTGGKLHGDGFVEEGLVQLPDNSILSYDVRPSPGGFSAQRYIQYGAPLPGSGTSPGEWVDASATDGTINYLLDDSAADGPGSRVDGPTMVRLPEGGMSLSTGARVGTLPAGAIFAMGSNGKTAFYIPPSAPGATNDYWTAGPDLPTDGGVQLVADESSAAVLPNGKVLVVLGDGDPTSNTSYLYEFDPTGNGPTWTNVTSTFTSQLPGVPLFNDGAWRLLVNPNGHVLVSNENGSGELYDFYDDSPYDASYTYPPGSQPAITNFTRNTGVPDNTTYTLTGTLLTGADEGSTSLDEGVMASNYPIVSFTSNTNGIVYYARTTG
jgi:hypothetical protein